MPSILLPGGVLAGRKKMMRLPTEQEAFDMCRGFAEFMNRLYPGYMWEVGMMSDIVYVRNLNLDKKAGFKLPLKDIDVDGRVLMRAGGELLERFRLKRGRKNVDAVRSLKRDIRGDAIMT